MSNELNIVIDKLKSELTDFCNDNGSHESDTGAFVFDGDWHEGYSEGIYRAIDLAGQLQCLPSKPKIKLTKTMPGEKGNYYWATTEGGPITIVKLEGLRDSLYSYGTGESIRDWGGYWAKVEQDHFEFDDGE